MQNKQILPAEWEFPKVFQTRLLPKQLYIKAFVVHKGSISYLNRLIRLF